MKSIQSLMWSRISPRSENIKNDLCKTFLPYLESFEDTEASKVRISSDNSTNSLKTPRLFVQTNKNEAQLSTLSSMPSIQRDKELFHDLVDQNKLDSKTGLTDNILCKGVGCMFSKYTCPPLSHIKKCIANLKNGFISQTPGKQMVNYSSDIKSNIHSLLNLISDKKETDQPFKCNHIVYMDISEYTENDFYDSEVDLIYSTPAELVENDSRILPGDEVLFSTAIRKDGINCSDNKDFEECLKKNPIDNSSCVSPETNSILSILNSVDKSAVIIQKDCYITNRILDSLKKKDERPKLRENENLEASSEKEVNYLRNRHGSANLLDLLLLTDRDNAALLKLAVEKAKQNSKTCDLYNETYINTIQKTSHKSTNVHSTKA